MSESTDPILEKHRITGATYEQAQSAISSCCVALSGMENIVALNVVAVVLLDVMANIGVPAEHIAPYLQQFFFPLVQQQAKDCEYHV